MLLRKILTWMGLILIGILIIPAGILIMLISTIWSLIDRIVRLFGIRKER